ncbi:MAG TPA: elongation factor 4 [Candidatus Parcubacteria bacterium]|nr:elongation factor 4 [Candidatus Parcubacteria bacterium]
MKKEETVRNFSIISHIDHGKSTLADRFLEVTGAISSQKMRPQFLDMMDLERERGITIRMQPVRMELDPKKMGIKINQKKVVLNLIDTPGHVDFSYEVSRSLAATEGAVLLVDATQGVQAQTLANLDLARKQGLVIIPVINKIDLEQANVEEVVKELANILETSEDNIIKISAKTGENVVGLIKAIIEKIPPPIEKEGPLRALIFDSEYDPYKGVVAYVRIMEGIVRNGQQIRLFASQIKAEVKEIGYFRPEFSSTNVLQSGEIGYIATGIKEPNKIRVGDTIMGIDLGIKPLPGYKEPQPMIFASLYPKNPDEFDILKTALLKLKLNDPSLTFEPETREALGRGFRCGFLGTLHVEIIAERLRREFGLELVISTPSVIYKLVDQKGEEKFIYGANDWPDFCQGLTIKEPWASLEIITPSRYMGKILDIFKDLRGSYIETRYISSERVVLLFDIPLAEIIANLYDKIKSVSQGYASMNYKVFDFRVGDLVKMEVLIAGEKEKAFSKIVPRERVYQEGRRLVRKIKDYLPPQQFSVAIQAAVGDNIIARETLKARRKDVTAPLYGGDYSRKKKLLEKQKRGKKKLKEKGKVRIPTKVFLEVFKG